MDAQLTIKVCLGVINLQKQTARSANRAQGIEHVVAAVPVAQTREGTVPKPEDDVTGVLLVGAVARGARRQWKSRRCLSLLSSSRGVWRR